MRNSNCKQEEIVYAKTHLRLNLIHNKACEVELLISEI